MTLRCDMSHDLRRCSRKQNGHTVWPIWGCTRDWCLNVTRFHLEGSALAACYLLLVYSSCLRHINFNLLSESHVSDVIHVAVTEIFRKIGANRFWLCVFCAALILNFLSETTVTKRLLCIVFTANKGKGRVHPRTSHEGPNSE
jgi:hypothetical protein